MLIIDTGCVKGKRECHWPDNSTASRSARPKKSKSSSDLSANSSADEIDAEGEPLTSIPDEDEDAEGEEQSDSVSGSDIRSTTPTKLHRQSQSALSSAVEGSTALPRAPARPQAPRSNSKQNVKASIFQSARWASLPKEVKFYLKFHRDHMSYHHFAFKYDGVDFLKTTYLEIALNDEALLYAVVSFAAYHYTVRQENGKMSHFLKYYNTSLKLLRESLAKSKRHTLSRLLTILQLATIEVCSIGST